jgi:general secretion pathway protein C
MKHLFKSKLFKKLFSILILLLLVKLLWFAVELLWLSPTGIGHDDEVGNKSLYYRVKLTPNEAPAPVKKLPTKIVGSIKDITLLAIYNSEDTTVITVEYKRKTKVLARGDEINGFVLEGAGSNFATFSKDSKTYRVDLLKSKKSTDTRSSIKSASRTEPVPAEDSSKVKGEVTDAGDHKIIDKSLLDHYAKNMDDIYKNIGISEVKKDGKIKGFRITFVRRGSPFAKLGIKRGDVIKSINGQEINSYNAAFEVYKNIQKVENLTYIACVVNIFIGRGRKSRCEFSRP